MSDLHKAAQQALWALQYHVEMTWPIDRTSEAIFNLRAALAEPCSCGDRPADQCPGEWEPGCDLGNNPKYAKQAEPKGGGRLPPPLQAEPVEPVAWYQKRGQEVLTSHPACWGREDEPWTPLYLAPPQRKPLTDEEIYDMYNEPRSDAEMVAFARAVEAAHGIKERV